MARARDGALVLDGPAVDRLLAGAAALRDAVETACAAGAEQRDLAPEKAALAELLDACPAGARDAARRRPRPSPGRARRAAAAAAPPPAADGAGRRPPLPSRRWPRTAAATARSSMVRVDFAKLDQLLNLVGELIVHRTKLAELGRQIAATAPEAGPASCSRPCTRSPSVSTQLQETIMDVRMLPIRHVFERFPRLVRDLARQQGKQIELVVQGEATRVDKAIIDEIGEPLVHLIRNAVDHGIEPPAVRAARGKSPTGTILLSAAQESNQVVITLVDDGGGIDAGEVRRTRDRARHPARRRADQRPRGDPAHLHRGLLHRAHGHRRVRPRRGPRRGRAEHGAAERPHRGRDDPGRGHEVHAAAAAHPRHHHGADGRGRRGASTRCPRGRCVESLRYRPDEVVRMNGRDTLRVRDRIVPLLHLAALFARGGAAGGRTATRVIVGRGEKRLGLTVDRLLGQQDVVIKALDPVVSEAAVGVAGATILGDGRVVLILDVASLFEGRRSRAGRAEAEA